MTDRLRNVYNKWTNSIRFLTVMVMVQLAITIADLFFD